MALPVEAVEQLKALIETYDRLKKNAIAAAAARGAASVAPSLPDGPAAAVVPPPAGAPPGAGVVSPGGAPAAAVVVPPLGGAPSAAVLLPLAGTPVPAAEPPAIPPSERPGTDDEIDILRARLANPSGIWWTDLVQAELCVIDVLDDASVRARIGGWRRRMQEVIGDGRYAQYIAGAPDPKTATIDSLRADLAECIRAVYYFYSSYGVAARSRSEVTKETFRVALLIIAAEAVVAIVLALHASPWHWWASLDANIIIGLEFLIATSAAAVLGSAVSVQTRLQDPAVEVDPFYRYVQTRNDSFSIAIVSPAFASVFGMLIYGLMASGLTGGNAFPHFNALISSHPPIGDVALLLIYGFIAGFAERLVPDALTRIATRTLASIAGGTPGGFQVGSPQPAAQVVLSLPSLALVAGAKGAFTATVSGSTANISATSSDTNIATVDSGNKTAPGPVTFTVVGLKAGQATVTVTCGTQSSTIPVAVT